MTITYPNHMQDIGLSIMNPFSYISTSKEELKYRKFIKLTKQLGNEGISSFNISDTQTLIKQIWATSGGYHGKDTIT